MKFLTTTVFNGQEFALFLEEATGRVFRSPIYDMPAQQHPRHVPMPGRDETFETPPNFAVIDTAAEAFAQRSPQVHTELPDKPRSIMPAGIADLMDPRNGPGMI